MLACECLILGCERIMKPNDQLLLHVPHVVRTFVWTYSYHMWNIQTLVPTASYVYSSSLEMSLDHLSDEGKGCASIGAGKICSRFSTK